MIINNKFINILSVAIVIYFITVKISSNISLMKCDYSGVYSKDKVIFSMNVDFNKKYSEYSMLEKIIYRICSDRIDRVISYNVAEK